MPMATLRFFSSPSLPVLLSRLRTLLLAVTSSHLSTRMDRKLLSLLTRTQRRRTRTVTPSLFALMSIPAFSPRLFTHHLPFLCLSFHSTPMPLVSSSQRQQIRQEQILTATGKFFFSILPPTHLRKSPTQQPAIAFL